MRERRLAVRHRFAVLEALPEIQQLRPRGLVAEQHVQLTVVVVDLALVVDRGEVSAGLDTFLGVLDEELEAFDSPDGLDEVGQLTGDFEHEHLLGCGFGFAGRRHACGFERGGDPPDRRTEPFGLPPRARARQRRARRFASHASSCFRLPQGERRTLSHWTRARSFHASASGAPGTAVSASSRAPGRAGGADPRRDPGAVRSSRRPSCGRRCRR
jgi:hypothetical protein